MTSQEHEAVKTIRDATARALGMVPPESFLFRDLTEDLATLDLMLSLPICDGERAVETAQQLAA